MLILKQSTAIDIRMGPFVDATDGVTPETGITLGAADQAEVLKADGAATVTMAGTFAAVTGADGWYDYTVASGDVDTVGETVFVVQDASVCLPIYVRAYVVEEAVYAAVYAAAAVGPALANIATEARLAELDAANLPADITALQASVDGIGTAGGAAISIDAATSNEGGGITGVTSGTTIVGTPTNTYTSTSILDGVYHIMTHAANAIDVVYQFLTGGGTEPIATVWTGYLTSANDTVTISAWDHVGGAWEIVGSIAGTGGSTNSVINPILYTRHRGTSAAEFGKVYIRLHCTGMSSPVLNTDQLYVEYAITSRSVGYAGGAVWVDTTDGTAGTESFVNGTADNPVLTFAEAITIAGNVGLHRYDMSPDSTITLAATLNSTLLRGHGWTLALGGQDVDLCHFLDAASVTGIGTAANEMEFHNCEIGTMSGQKVHWYDCTFDGTVTMTLAGDYHIINSQSGVAGAGAPTFIKTAGQAITAEWRRWSGGVTLSGLELGDTVTISGELGTVTLNGADAAVEIRGTYKELINNLTGSPTVNVDGAILAADVAEILVDTSTTLQAGVTSIKSITDQMAFSKANELNANIKSINDAEVVGDGDATPWDGA